MRSIQEAGRNGVRHSKCSCKHRWLHQRGVVEEEKYVLGPVYFEETDFTEEELPGEGYYESTIASAEVKKSLSGNVMLLVVHELLGVRVPYDRVSDYFVLEGPTRAVRVAKSRLVRLFYACGLHPKSGDEIASQSLFGARLEVKVEHDAYRGQPRLRVKSYYPLDLSKRTERVPF